MNKQEIQHEIDRVEKVVSEASALLHNLREELKKPDSTRAWRASHGEKYYTINNHNEVVAYTESGNRTNEIDYVNGNYFPFTEEGKKQAERYAFCIGFRARWNRSADCAPSDTSRFIPGVDSLDQFQVTRANGITGTRGWSTRQACLNFVHAEGGASKFKEILQRGIL